MRCVRYSVVRLEMICFIDRSDGTEDMRVDWTAILPYTICQRQFGPGNREVKVYSQGGMKA